MALGPTRPLFSQRWQDKFASAPERGMDCVVRIYDPKTSQAVYNRVTGTYDSVPTVMYEGKARVQPRRNASLGNDTSVRDVLVSIPISAGRNLVVRPFHRAVVVSSPLNPSLTNYLFTVKDGLDSGDPIERTLIFQVNQETQVA